MWYGIAAPAMIALVLLTELAECPFLTPRWGNRPAFLYRILDGSKQGRQPIGQTSSASATAQTD